MTGRVLDDGAQDIVERQSVKRTRSVAAALATLTLMTGGCMSIAPPEPPVMSESDPCDAGAYRQLIGVDISETGLIGGALLRIIRPGDLVTEDHRPDRANVAVDAQDRIVRAFCG